MYHRVLCLSFIVALPLLQAQPVVAPSPDRVVYSRGSESDSYNVTNSFETGYRLASVGGDSGLYRSNENYRNGPVLFWSSLTANSTDGHGALFDSLAITTQGLGSDPYGMAMVHVEKNDLYRYDMTWRTGQYFNPALLDGESGTLMDTRRTMQDHDLAISLRKWATLQLGYTRNHETGPALSNYELYIGGLARSVLPLSLDTRQDWNEYRLGAQLDFHGFRFTFSHLWDFYKDDTSVASLVPGQPYPVTNTSVATSYFRSAPMHIQTPGWFGNLNRTARLWALNARMTYTKANQQDIYDETEKGPGVAPLGPCKNCGIGPPATASTVNLGTARRPLSAGDLTLSLYPSSRLTIVNSLSAQNSQNDGDGSMLQVNTSAATKNILWLQRLDEFRLSDSLDADYRVNKWVGLNAEYRYTDRRLENNLIRQGTTNSRDINSLSDHLNAGTFGFRLKPLQPLTVNLDLTIGRDNGPDTPVSLAHYHNIRGRVQYRQKRWQIGATYRELYNLNSPAIFAYSWSHSRDLSGNASFEVRHSLSLDMTYTHAHLHTFGNIYAELPLPSGVIVNVRGYSTQFESNIHTVTFLARTAIKKRAALYLGYNLTRDTGDGRAVQDLGLQNPASAYLALANTFPMSYQAPLARVSVRMAPKLQWNFGWEFYRYNQRFAYFGYQPYYRAQTGYTSVSWAF